MKIRLGKTALHFKDVKEFLGPGVARYLFLGFLSGIVLFCIEFAFAFSLQAFLYGIGVMSKSEDAPTWLLGGGLSAVLLFVFFIGACRALMQWGHVYFTSAASETMKFQQRVRILQWAFYGRSVGAGKLATLFNENSWAAASCVGSLQSVSIYLPTFFLLWLSLVYMAWIPTVIATIFLGVLALLMKIVDRKISILGHQIAKETNRTNSDILRNIKNLLLVKIYGTQEREMKTIYSSVLGCYKDMLSYGGFSGLKYALPQLIGVGMICGLALISTRWGELSPGRLVAYFYLFLRFVQNVGESAKTVASFKLYGPQTLQLAEWWKEFFRGQLDDRIEHTNISSYEPFAGPIGWRLSGVEYMYPQSNGPVIRGIDVEINPGDIWVITGPSGAGKSTLLSLLLGTISPTQGEIEIIDSAGTKSRIADLQGRLLQSVGYVGPESFLIEGTILDNLTYGLYVKPGEAQIRAALESAECGFVFNLSMGLEHHLTEQGEGLSAGQKQRLCLARALLRQPRVLILDEATANLDLETESRLVETLAKIGAGMTIVAVTHREGMLRIATKNTRLDFEQVSPISVS